MDHHVIVPLSLSRSFQYRWANLKISGHDLLKLLLILPRQCEGRWHLDRYSCDHQSILDSRFYLLRNICLLRDASRCCDEEIHTSPDVDSYLYCLVSHYNVGIWRACLFVWDCFKFISDHIVSLQISSEWSSCWLIFQSFTGFIQNVGGLYATRLILGACEAGLFPCLNLYLTMVYRREEQAKRVAYLFVCAALSGAFGGLLAYVLLKMDGVSGLAGWR